MTILGIDSSATAGSAAVIEGNKILSETFINIGMTHSQALMPLIIQALDMAEKKVSDLDLIAVVTGPGSFTGIRIGVATAKGLAQPNSIPCFGVSSLECIAQPLSVTGVIAVPVMDARCQQVYSAIFDTQEGRLKRLREDSAEKLSDLADILQKYYKPKVLIGDGTEIAFEYLRDKVDNILHANEIIRYQRASSAAFIAKNALEIDGQSPLDAPLLKPSYLRIPQAERELKRKKD